VPARSTELSAVGCWNTGGGSACASTTFRYGEEREVVIRAEPKPAPPATTKLVLLNPLDYPVEIVARTCGFQGVFGFQASHATFWINCGCTCTPETRGTRCPPVACGPCEEDVIEVLQPGDEFEYVWDHKFWNTLEMGCSIPRTFGASDTAAMRACWRRPGAKDRECMQAEIKGSDAQVTFAVRAPRTF
jgi:hypothetical protein